VASDASQTFKDERRLIRAIRLRIQKSLTFSSEVESYIRNHGASAIRSLKEKYILTQEYMKILDNETSLQPVFVLLVEYGCVANYPNANTAVAQKVKTALEGWKELESNILKILEKVPEVPSTKNVPKDCSVFKLPGVLRACIVTMALMSCHPSLNLKDFFEGNHFYSLFRNFVR